MKCAWEYFIRVLPLWMREKVDELGKNHLQELRLRINAPPELVSANKSYYLSRHVTADDLAYCINLATKYSPWASETLSAGYLTIQGGHRIGICGSLVSGGQQRVFSVITSICIRISRDFHGIASGAVTDGSILLIGKPGSGKTTFLRDLVRQISAKDRNRVVVVDERYEIFPFADSSFCFEPGNRVDILSGCSKEKGIEMVMRSMTPTAIAVDEITAASDADIIRKCVGCGVSLLATAHAANLDELEKRPIYRTLLDCAVFQTLILLRADCNWRWEYIKL